MGTPTAPPSLIPVVRSHTLFVVDAEGGLAMGKKNLVLRKENSWYIGLAPPYALSCLILHVFYPFHTFFCINVVGRMRMSEELSGVFV